MSETCIIGTRGSALALWQAHAVESALHEAFPNIETEVRTITTSGDRILDVPLEKIGDKGLFTKELERTLLSGEVDVCVHSLKDMPVELPDGCAIAGVLPRADARDVLVCGPRLAQAHGLEDIPAGARLGTGSLRRTAQLRAGFPHVEPKGIRGNVDTRLAKANGDEYDGAILAAAGVMRMGRAAEIAAFLPVGQMVPAVGQGAVCMEIRQDDEQAAALCAAVNDAATLSCVAGERRVLRELEGGCQVPIGAYARIEDDRTVFDAVVLSLDGSRVARSHREAEASTSPTELAGAVLDDLRAQDAEAILAEIRAAGEDA